MRAGKIFNEINGIFWLPPCKASSFADGKTDAFQSAQWNQAFAASVNADKLRGVQLAVH
jgi:predicted RecA/RadA family phage recombinase